MVNRFYSLEENRVIPIIKQYNHENEMDDDPFCLGSSGHGWLVYSNRSDCALFLYNPISHRIIKLPSVDTLGVKPYNGFPFSSAQNLILSSPPDEEGCIAMCIYASNTLNFCRPGHDAAWIPLGDIGSGKIAYSSKENLFYSLKCTSTEALDCWDLSDPSSPKRKLVAELGDRWDLRPFPAETYYEWMLRFDAIIIETYLLWESWCVDFILVIDRFMVFKNSTCEGSPDTVTLFFEVFKVDLNNGVVQYVDDSLNDRALFVGKSHSFSLPTQGSQHLRPNSIYFANHYPSSYLDEHNLLYGDCDVGNFNYEHKVMERFGYPRDLKSVEPILEMRPCPVWFVPDLAS